MSGRDLEASTPPSNDSNPGSDRTAVESDTNGPTPSTSRGSISSFLFMTIMLFMLTNGGDDLVAQSQYRETLRSLHSQQGNFSIWLKGYEAANFTMPEPDLPTLDLAHAAMAFGGPLHPQLASYYSNITGFVHGPGEIHNLSMLAQAPNTSTGEPLSTPTPSWSHLAKNLVRDVGVTSVVESLGSWNWSAKQEIAFRVLEKRPVYDGADGIAFNDTDAVSLQDVSVMHGRVEITDTITNDELGFDLEAVHFISNGTIYGFAEPDGRHVDVRSLPSLVPKQFENITGQAINIELLTRIKKLQDMIDSGVTEFDISPTEELPKANCSFTLFLQLVPTDVPLRLMQELEAELDTPTGISTVARPELKVNGVLISPNCGILFEVREAEGLKSQRFWRKVTTYSSVASLFYLALLWLFVRQTDASQTPTGISRISRWTFLTQAATDSVSFVGHITFGILADGRPSLSLIAPAFLASVLLVYEARFSVVIHQIQAPEEATPPPPPPPTPEAAPEANGSTVTPASTPAIATTLPAGLAAGIWRRLLESPQGRLFICMIAALAIFIRVLISPSLALWTVTLIYSSFWIPQIVRSARRGTSAGLTAEYLFGTTCCRAFFALYLFGCPKNVLGVDSSPWIYALLAFMFLQILTIILQEQFGPAFFLPSSYSHIQRYDYHPALPVPDAEAPRQANLGDCVICMDAIEVASLPYTGTNAGYDGEEGVGLLQRRHSRGAGSKERLDDNDKYEEPRSRDDDGGRGHVGRRHVHGGLLSRFWSVVRDRTASLKVGPHGGSLNARRKVYALAPCSHLFHTACLEKWLAIKNICPQCRCPLPPL